MDLPLQHKLALEKHRAIKLQFILTELDLAITFSDMAVNAKDKIKAQRNADNAHNAYAAAKHFLNEDEFPERMRQDVRDRVTKLKPLLRKLQEHRDSSILEETADLP